MVFIKRSKPIQIKGFRNEIELVASLYCIVIRVSYYVYHPTIMVLLEESYIIFSSSNYCIILRLLYCFLHQTIIVLLKSLILFFHQTVIVLS